jgi:hypothetical protein
MDARIAILVGQPPPSLVDNASVAVLHVGLDGHIDTSWCDGS